MTGRGTLRNLERSCAQCVLYGILTNSHHYIKRRRFLTNSHTDGWEPIIVSNSRLRPQPWAPQMQPQVMTAKQPLATSRKAPAPSLGTVVHTGPAPWEPKSPSSQDSRLQPGRSPTGMSPALPNYHTCLGIWSKKVQQRASGARGHPGFIPAPVWGCAGPSTRGSHLMEETHTRCHWKSGVANRSPE